MLDKETLGTRADAVIISIGAVKFDLDSDRMNDNAYYASVSVDSNLDAGRKIDESTLLWWMGQEPAAREVFFEPKQSLESALIGFCDWFGGAKYIWSNGADFDIAMLAHALRSFGMDVPWQFYDSRCVRTYKNIPGMKNIKAANPLKHNALQDAIAQAKQMQAIQKRLNSIPHPMVKAAT